MRRALLVLIFGMMILTTGCSAVEVVQPSQVGVVFNRFTGDLGDPLMPGTHVVDPLSDEVMIYSTATQELTLAAGSDDPYDAVDVVLEDGEEAHIDVSIFFSVDPQSVNMLYTRWQDRYVSDYVLPTVGSVIRDVATRYPATRVYADLRDDFQNDIRSELSEELAKEGLILNNADIRGMTFSQEFTHRIEQQLILTATAAAITVTPSP